MMRVLRIVNVGGTALFPSPYPASLFRIDLPKSFLDSPKPVRRQNPSVSREISNTQIALSGTPMAYMPRLVGG